MHGFDCVWVRSILAAVSFTVRGVMVYDLLVSWASSVGHAGLAFDLADLAASMVQPGLISDNSQLSYWVVNHLVVLWLPGGSVAVLSGWIWTSQVFGLPNLVVSTEPRVAGLRLDRHQFWWQQN